MKNRLIFIICLFFFSNNLFAKNLLIQAKNISIDKNKKITIFENNVSIQTEDNYLITSDFAEYNKETGIIILKKNITGTDDKKNTIKTNYAEYNEISKILISKGQTEIITSDNYIIEGSDIILDNNFKFIKSDSDAVVTDQDKNNIYLNNFDYQTKNNIFKSIGSIKINDILGNEYQFSQIYIDAKKKEILATDNKSFLNSSNFKIKENNKPRIFSNTIKIKDKNTEFGKSVFTLCDYRKNDKCPPWSIQSKKMLHDGEKKTIYYDNAVVKVYDIPVFYLPRLSHPDPSVDRRSGFLVPFLTNSKNLGSGVSVPYFFALDKDKNFTFTNRLYNKENPFFNGEYHQALKNSNLIADFGFTEGYKKTSDIKTKGSRSHFFAKFNKDFFGKNNSQNTLNLSTQQVSDDKYLKLYKIKSNIVDFNNNTLENSLSFTHENEDLFFGLNANIYETLKDDYNDKYEYILPEITLDKNLKINRKFGDLGLQTNLKVHNYDTNKLNSFFVNDINWRSNNIISKFGFNSNILGNIKNINYESKNDIEFKNEPTSELFGTLGYLTNLSLRKTNGLNKHFLTPKMLLRYSPGSMRKEKSGSRLDPTSAFDLSRLNKIDNFETGLTSTLGFDYKIKNNSQDFNISAAQIFNEKENKKMSSVSSLDEKNSDLVGAVSATLNKNINLSYNFNLDQNYKDINYSDIGTQMNFGALNINFNYLKEQKHIGNNNYFKSKIALRNNDNGLFTFETKRNLITDSSEFYDLSYEYINDCLRAGLVYRREFYNDSELEAENSLLFKITLIPFGNINSPMINQ
jgi:LPS-assembly protein